MFGTSYFGTSYFGPTYFGPGAAVIPSYGAFSYVLIGPKKKRKRVEDEIEFVWQTIERSIMELEAEPQKKPIKNKILALKTIQIRLEDIQAVAQAMTESVLDDTLKALEMISRRLTQAEIKRINARLLALKRRADAELLLIMAAIDG